MSDTYTNETRADILREMRTYFQTQKRNGNPEHRPWHQVLSDWADRIEAAAKRERVKARRDAEIEWARIGYEERKAEEKREPGNAAAMREALIQCELFLGHVSRHGHPTLNPGDKCTACDGVDELRGMVVRALATPLRNCDRPECATRDGAYNTWYRETWKMSRDDFPDWSAWLFAKADGGAE